MNSSNITSEAELQEFVELCNWSAEQFAAEVESEAIIAQEAA